MTPDLSTALDTLRQRVPDALAVYVFGSEARGEGHADSDLDLALLAPQPLESIQRFDVQEAIAAALRRDVDLVDLRAASTVMQMQVVHTGRVVLDRDPRARAAFETVVFSAYALLNEERAEILEAIADRGQVYE